MPIIVICGALVIAGLVMGGAWSSRTYNPPAADRDLSLAEAAQKSAWYGALTLTGGVIAGVPMIGAAGRLAMRLLAVTGGDEAQGRLTEADEVVGEISVGGTIAFVLFNGIFGGVIAAAIYLMVRRFLPAGWVGGLAFGAVLLVVLGTTVDPLRADNPDFDIVGPGWLSVLVFTAMALAFGVVLAAVIARLSTWLPLLTTERRVIVRYIAPGLLAILAAAATAFFVVASVVAVALSRSQTIVDAVRSRRAVLVGRVVVGLGVLIALPNAVRNVVDIVTNSP